MNDKLYIAAKLAHLKRIGISAGINPETGACQTDWAKSEAEQRRINNNKIMDKRKKRDD